MQISVYTLPHPCVQAALEPSQAPAADAAPVDAKATVQGFYSAWNRGDIDGMAACCTEDVVYHDVIYLEPFIGRDAFRGFLQKMANIKDFGCLKVVVTDLVGDDSACAVAGCVSALPFKAHSFVCSAWYGPLPDPSHCELGGPHTGRYQPIFAPAVGFKRPLDLQRRDLIRSKRQ